MDFIPIIREEYQKALPILASRRNVIQTLQERFRRQLLEFVMNECAGKMGRAADYLGISRNSLRKYCTEAGVDVPAIVDKHR